jgi:DNA-binding response OmpR family regulator
MAIILLINEDSQTLAAITEGLAAQGHIVDISGTVHSALQNAGLRRADAVVLCLDLSATQEEAALRDLREQWDVPIVVASSHGDEQTVVRMLNLGADDYLVRPCSIAQLTARIDAVLRRSAHSAPHTGFTEVGDLRIDFQARTIQIAGILRDLTPIEFELLCVLAKNPNKVVSREEVTRAVWRRADLASYQLLRTHLSSLRRKLGESATEPRYLHTMRGIGLKFTAPPNLAELVPVEGPALVQGAGIGTGSRDINKVQSPEMEAASTPDDSARCGASE